MIDIQLELKKIIKKSLNDSFNYECNIERISIDTTPKNFEGFYTFIIFPHIKYLKCNPEEAGNIIGEYIIKNSSIISGFNIVKGFLNLDLSLNILIELFKTISSSKKWGFKKFDGEEVMVEFASPNTNKPLHLGHLRNIFLGDSMSRILEANGKRVYKVQIINDRGIHICKSMVAWKLFSGGKTPESLNIKGDKFVGDYYVKYDKENQKQIRNLIDKGMNEEDASKQTELAKGATNLLRLWEEKDKSTIELWKMMNNWVYEGFNYTYKSVGISFDKNYYESETYLLGKENIKIGLNKNIFFEKKDGSVWVDLSKQSLDNKLLLRSDGTSVYITQDIGTAIKRFKDHPKIKKQIYTVGNEQDYHFKVLFKILEKLGYEWAKECYHLSYGMVDLPDGKMKSREGNVVDADDLVNHMVKTAKSRTEELGKIDDFDPKDSVELYNIIALGALKYYLLKVDPKKKMLFDPEESIDFHGNTGPFIQYTYARIRSIIRRAESLNIKYDKFNFDQIKNISNGQKKIIDHIYQLPKIIKISSDSYSPSLISQFIYDLSKLFNSFYQEEKIIDGKNNETTSFKIALSHLTSTTIKNCLELLGIDVPNKM